MKLKHIFTALFLIPLLMLSACTTSVSAQNKTVKKDYTEYPEYYEFIPESELAIRLSYLMNYQNNLDKEQILKDYKKVTITFKKALYVEGSEYKPAYLVFEYSLKDTANKNTIDDDYGIYYINRKYCSFDSFVASSTAKTAYEKAQDDYTHVYDADDLNEYIKDHGYSEKEEKKQAEAIIDRWLGAL